MGSRLSNTKGKNLLNAIIKEKCIFLSISEPTYWPSDLSKKPDLIDFCIAKNLNKDTFSLKSCFDLSSDHSPIVIQLFSNIIVAHQPLYNQKTDWSYRDEIENNLECKIALKDGSDRESNCLF